MSRAWFAVCIWYEEKWYEEVKAKDRWMLQIVSVYMHAQWHHIEARFPHSLICQLRREPQWLMVSFCCKPHRFFLPLTGSTYFCKGIISPIEIGQALRRPLSHTPQRNFDRPVQHDPEVKVGSQPSRIARSIKFCLKDRNRWSLLSRSFIDYKL